MTKLISLLAVTRPIAFLGRLVLLALLGSAFVLPVTSSNASNPAALAPLACAIPDFSSVTNITMGLGQAALRAVVVGDFNNDGRPDIAAADDAVTGDIFILLGNGSGGFSAPTSFHGGRKAIMMATGDLNGDGNLDLVTANEENTQRAFSVLLGNGAGGFGTQTFFLSGSQATITSVAVGDVNGDGKLDVAITNGSFGAITIGMGDGTGQFPTFKNLSSGGSSPNYLVIRDINGDSKADLIVSNQFATNQSFGSIGVLIGDGAGNFSAVTTYSVGTAPGSISAGDFNGDGKIDLAVANIGSNNISVLLGDGTGNFNPPVNYGAGGVKPVSIVSGDLNGDGKTDLAIQNARPGSVAILLGDGLGAFTPTANFVDGGPLFAGVRSSGAIADFNGDGRLDLTFANDSTRVVSVMLNACGSLSPGQLRLTNSSCGVFENQGTSISSDSLTRTTVIRTGDITGSASVDIATIGGSATAPQDFGSVSSTLTFAPGEVFKEIAISLTDDDIPEPTEQFDLTLSSATGNASLGSPSTATVTIFDDDQALIHFPSSSVNINEGGGSPTIDVTRSGNTMGAGTVSYATSDTAGSSNCNVINHVASSRCDYIASVGTLHFAPGETSKSIPIPVIDDSYAESGEAFTLTLSNPSGLGFTLGGGETSVSVSIIDNDTVNGATPIDTSGFFVRQHYLDFLNREPDTSGLNFWTGEIDNCAPKPQCTDIKRINVSAAFFLSIEFQDTGYLVERIYKASYGSATGTSTFGGTHQFAVPIIRLNEFLPDTQEIGLGVVVGQGNWQQQLDANKAAFTAEFIQRARFTTAFPNTMTPAQFVDTLNTNAGNPLSPGERDQLVNDLATNAKTRAQVLRAVAEDSDLNSAESNRAFVLMQFFGYLRRNPNEAPDTDYTGYDFWLTKLNQFNGNFVNADMVKAFITSGEYRQRFGP